jgi:hypothetical protein
MFKPGDICLVKDNDVLSGLYRSLIGKHVIILNGPVINDKYPIDVISPESMFQRSTQLQMRASLLVKEVVECE